ncbi:MAG: peroxide stress protein YaaA [Micrococcaceae bacterium]
MMILLPPSEGKTQATGSQKLDLSSLSFPELTKDREKVLTTLIKVSQQKNSLEVLGVGKSLASEIERNSHLLNEPVAPAHQIYTGVLYDALDFNSLTPAEKKKATEHIFIQSALWGLISLADAIPAYRLSMGTKLGRLGNLSTWWKKELTQKIKGIGHDELFIDCRSGTYQKAWPTPPQQTVLIKPFEMVKGKKKVITHMAKQARGLVARELIESRAKLESIEDVAKVLRKKWNVEVIEPHGTQAWVFEIVAKSS